MGWPEEDLRLVAVNRAGRPQKHAIAVVRTGDALYALDQGTNLKTLGAMASRYGSAYWSFDFQNFHGLEGLDAYAASAAADNEEITR